MARHLTAVHLNSALNRGKIVEQLLSARVVDDRWEVSWVELWPGEKGEEGKFLVCHHFVWSQRARGMWDITEWPSIDDTEDHGEGFRQTFDDLEAAFQCIEELGGSRTRFVNFGVIQDEVHDALGVT